MNAASKKIYYAKKKWNCSFEELSYLLDIPWDEVRELYRQEVVERLPKITMNSDIRSLSILTTRTKNSFFRHGIRTVKDFITYTERFDAISGCGRAALVEIAEARSAIATVLKLNVPSLISAFSTGGVVLDISWMDDEPSNSKIITKWEVTGTKMEKVPSISGRIKGWLKTIFVQVWLN